MTGINDTPPVEPSHRDVVDGDDSMESEIPAATRQWVTKTLFLSFVLPIGVIGVIGAVWLMTVRAAPRAQRSQVLHHTAELQGAPLDDRGASTLRLARS